MYGQNLHLPEYLRFGILVGPTQQDLERKVAQELAGEMMHRYHLGEYSQPEEVRTLRVDGDPHYAALIVWMPETVDNHANHQKGAEPPWVQLGVRVYAQQAGTPMN